MGISWVLSPLSALIMTCTPPITESTTLHKRASFDGIRGLRLYHPHPPHHFSSRVCNTLPPINQKPDIWECFEKSTTQMLAKLGIDQGSILPGSSSAQDHCKERVSEGLTEGAISHIALLFSPCDGISFTSTTYIALDNR